MVQLQDCAVTAGNAIGHQLANFAVDNDTHIAAGGISALASNSVTAGTIADGAVTNGKIAAGAVTNDKLGTELDGAKLSSQSVDTAQLADDSVTTNKIADQSIVTSHIQPAQVTNNLLATGIDGAKLVDDSVDATKFDPSAFSGGITLDDTVQHSNQVTPGQRNGIIYDQNGHITATAALDASDLPLATTTSPGAVSIPDGSGLTVSPTGAVDHVDLMGAAGAMSGIAYDNHGHIISVTPLVASDLPVATSLTIGGVSIPSTNNNPLTLSGEGAVSHSQSAITPGTYVALSVDQYGHAIAGSDVLSANQIPGLDASKITTGQFATGRIADNAITREKLANYSISYIQEVQPTSVDPIHIGGLWYQESTAQLRMWNGNSWMSVGFGRLSQDNLRFGGTVSAATGLVVNLTDSGRNGGLEIGEALPTATDQLGGLYLVVSTPGASIDVTPGITYDAGDWCLCVNETEGWVRIDTLNSGGGGSLIALNDLLDVDLTDPQPGDTLLFDPTSGQWVNQSTSAERVTLSPAFDGTTTVFTLSMEIVDQNNLLVSLGGVIQQPGVDFQVSNGTRDIYFASPPPTGTPYFILNQQSVNAGGGGGGGGTDLPPGTASNELLQWNNTLSTWGPTTEIDGGSF